MPLAAGTTHGLNVRRCPSCGGIWISAEVVSAVVEHRNKSSFSVDSRGFAAFRCPADGARLARFAHSGVEIDTCVMCGGIWLDHGELQTILSKKNRYSLAEEVIHVGLDAAVPLPVHRSGVDQCSDDSSLLGDVLECVLEFIGDAFSAP